MVELTRKFLIESQEGLDRMEQCLTELEARPQDAALLGEIFRSVHTIKGTTGFLGFKRLEKLAHAGENLLGLLRDGKLAADRQLITGLLHLLDGLRSILKLIETEAGEGDGEDIALIEQLEALQAPVHSAAKQSRRVQAVVQVGPSNPPAPPPPASLPPAPLPMVEQRLAPSPAPELPTSVPNTDVQAHAPEAEPDALRPRVSAPAAGSTAESTLRVDVVLLNRR